MEKRWDILHANHEQIKSLQADLGIHPALCQILVQRNILDFQQAKDFFRPSLEQLHDPFLMKDMDKAVDRIQRALSNQEKILVFGDYDVDGTTAVAVMYQFIVSIHSEELTEFYIPHRYREGYGVSKMGIDYAFEHGFTLIISLDCGIKSADLVAYAASLGIDFIICDHHLPDAVLPKAAAILNPKQKDCKYPYRELCGCGVGFKLIQALSTTRNIPPENCHRYLDLVATAIAADIVPMTGENRILAYHGLQQINQQPSPGIKCLIELGGIQSTLTISNVVFVIAPRVNAAGRMDDARKAVLLFIEKDPNKAMELAKELHHDNSDRKEADSNITEEALDILSNTPDLADRKSTVVFQPHWHKGVVGIVASRLIEKHYKPTVVLTRSGDVVAGSARSVNGFNLHEAIHSCREHLLGYGGHFAAAGLSMLPEKVADFSRCFEEVVSQTIQPDSLLPTIAVDATIALKDIQPSLYRIIQQMEPFGPENLRPVFLATQVRDTGQSRLVKEEHLKIVVQQDGVTLSGIGFNMKHIFPLLQHQQPVDVLFSVDENHWNGQTTLQMRLIDLRPSHPSKFV